MASTRAASLAFEAIRTEAAAECPGAVVTFETPDGAAQLGALERMVRLVADAAAGRTDATIVDLRRAGDTSLSVTTSADALAYELCESVQEAFGGRLCVRAGRGGRRPHLGVQLDSHRERAGPRVERMRPRGARPASSGGPRGHRPGARAA